MDAIFNHPLSQTCPTGVCKQHFLNFYTAMNFADWFQWKTNSMSLLNCTRNATTTCCCYYLWLQIIKGFCVKIYNDVKVYKIVYACTFCWIYLQRQQSILASLLLAVSVSVLSNVTFVFLNWGCSEFFAAGKIINVLNLSSNPHFKR